MQYSNYQSLWLRTSSLTICAVFIWTNVLFAQRANPDFWEERQKNIETRGLRLGTSNKTRNELASSPKPLAPALLAQLPALQTNLPHPELNQTFIPSLEKGSVYFGKKTSPAKKSLLNPALHHIYPKITQYATIKEAFLPSEAHNKHSLTPLVIHIQDIHENYEAQQNISTIITAIVEAQRNRSPKTEDRKPRTDVGFRSSVFGPRSSVVVGLEGAWGPLNLAPYRAFPDKEITADIADYFLKEGLIGGPEHAGLISENDNLQLTGLENQNLYQNHVKAFKDSVLIEKQTKQNLMIIQTKLEQQKKQVYTPKLLELDSKMSAYHKVELGLGEYLTYLSKEGNVVAQFTGGEAQEAKHSRPLGLSSFRIERRSINNETTPDKSGNYINISLFLHALHLEKSLDFTKVEQERKEIIELLAEKLPESRINELINASLAYRQGQITGAEFYNYFQNVAAGFNLRSYPEFSRYIRYVITADRINHEGLLNEITALEEKVFTMLARFSPQPSEIIRLHEITKDLTLVEKLLNHSLTPEEWKTYKQRSERVYELAELGQTQLQTFENFFEYAESRNQALVENLLTKVREPMTDDRKPIDDNQKSMSDVGFQTSDFGLRTSVVAVLVAGGFHTPGLTRIMREQGIPYLVLTPRITKLEGNPTDYLNVFTRDKTPLEKLFTGERLTLKATPLTNSSAPMNDVITRFFTQLEISAALAKELQRFPTNDINKLAKQSYERLYNHLEPTVKNMLRKGDTETTVKQRKIFWNEAGLWIKYTVSWEENGKIKNAESEFLITPQETINKIETKLAYKRSAGKKSRIAKGNLQRSNFEFEVFKEPESLVANLVEMFRPYQNMRFTEKWRKAVYYLGVGGWEEIVFRWGGLIGLPMLFSYSATGLTLGLIWSGPVFLFLHPFLRWLARNHVKKRIFKLKNKLQAPNLPEQKRQGLVKQLEVFKTSQWKGWRKEIAREFGYFSLSPFFRSRAFATILFNAAYLTITFLITGTWLTANPTALFSINKLFFLLSSFIFLGPPILIHFTWNILSKQLSLAVANILGLTFDSKQEKFNDTVLKILGLSYDEFQLLIRAQNKFELDMIRDEPLISKHIFSLRTQQRFSETVLELTKLFRQKGIENYPSFQAIDFALNQFYGDLIGLPGWSNWTTNPAGYFKFFQVRPDPNILQILLSPDKPINEQDYSTAMVARAFATQYPVLFNEEPSTDIALTNTIYKLADSISAKVTTMWSHPFTEERQLIGHKVPKTGMDRLVFGYGELMRAIQQAQEELDLAKKENRKPKKHVLLIKNIEAMDPEVRTQLQELLRIRELTHPELGTVILPDNFQIMMTKHHEANLEDDSFYDRVLVKTVRTGNDLPTPPTLTDLTGIVPKQNYLDFVKIEKWESQLSLVTASGKPTGEFIRIPMDSNTFKHLADKLSDGYHHDMSEEILDEIYIKTGLVLDFDTLRMLAAMEETVQSGRTLLRLEGPTGVGKTFTAGGYARLRGSSFLSNPVSNGSELPDLIGGFEQDEDGQFQFNSNTTVKERLEEGGVVALSELNTLLDQNEKVSLAWWLVQIAETQPDKDGYKTIKLTEVPVPQDANVPTILIHPKTLIVIDTNPEGDYSARGTFPDIFKEYVPALPLNAFVTADGYKTDYELKKIRTYLNMFLKHDWILEGTVKAKGISDAELRKKLSIYLSNTYQGVAMDYMRGEIGRGETSIFSVRELKRMAEDVLYALSQGKNENKVIQEAAINHLVARWQSAEDRKKTVGLLPNGHSPSNEKAVVQQLGFNNFLADQLLEKNRAVHVRITPETDLRWELSSFQSEHPETIMKIIPVSNETDRFMLEGGLVPLRDGQRNIFGLGHGIMGRLIEEAKTYPNKQVVYVLENTHNLKPEEIVALNEILQDRKLYRKGRDTKQTLPLNAHILLVSRTDSELAWSPAEQSRFVVLGYSQDESYLTQLFAQKLSAILSNRGAPPELISHLQYLILHAYKSLDKDLAQDAVLHVRRSNRRFARFLNVLAVKIRDIPPGQLNADILYDLAVDTFRHILLLGFEPEQITANEQKYRSQLVTFKQIDQWDEMSTEDNSHPTPATESSQLGSELAKAMLNVDISQSPDQRNLALAELRNSLTEHQDDLEWTETDRQSIRPMVIGKAYIPTQDWAQTGDFSVTALSTDGNVLVTDGKDRVVKIYERDSNKKYVLLQQSIIASASRNVKIKSIAHMTDQKGPALLILNDDGYISGLRFKNYPNSPSGYYVPIYPIIGSGSPIITESMEHIVTFAVSGEANSIVTAKNDGKVRVYDSRDGRLLQTFNPRKFYQRIKPRGQSTESLALSLSADGTTLIVRTKISGVAGRLSGRIDYFGLDKHGQYKFKQSWPENNTYTFSENDIAISPDGKTLAAGNDIFVLENGKFGLKQSLPNSGSFHSFFLNGRGLAIKPIHNPVLYVYLLKNGVYTLAHTIPSPSSSGEFTSLSVSEDGKNIVAGIDSRMASLYRPVTFITGDNGTATDLESGLNITGDIPAKFQALDLENLSLTPLQRLIRAQNKHKTFKTNNERLMMQNEIAGLIQTNGDKFEWVTASNRDLSNGDILRIKRLGFKWSDLFGLIYLIFAPITVFRYFWERVPKTRTLIAYTYNDQEQWFLDLKTNQSFKRKDLPRKVEKLDINGSPISSQKTPPVAAQFAPRYGSKPYYFMVDREGEIYLNFKGRMYATRHKLLNHSVIAGDRFPSSGFIPLELSNIRNPYAEGEVPLAESDFLMETEVMEKVEDSMLQAFTDGWHVNLEGKAGAGKTSIAREMAMLLGLPRTVFQMHGEREIWDWIGTWREDNYGNLVLSNTPWTDHDGRLPLLDLLVNGGVFVVDEGAIGEQGREIISWLSSIVQGDKKIYLEEFPGQSIELNVHPDFHLVITNNPPEETQGRQVLKSEIASNVHFIHVEEDDSPEVLERLFVYFMGNDISLNETQKRLLANIVTEFHHTLKPLIGKELGKDDKDRYYISKREIRRVAAQVRKHSLAHPGDDGLYVLYKAMRIVYEAMFSYETERQQVLNIIQEQMAQKIGNDSVSVLHQRLQGEIMEKFSGAATAHEAWVAWTTDAMLEQDEPVLYISEIGSRTTDMLKYAAQERGAKITVIDAAPEHTELEILGGLFPILSGDRRNGKRSKFVKGAITRYLMTKMEMDTMTEQKEKHGEAVVWIRNIDQWTEDIRTALNGFLEDGFIDLEADEGKNVRFYKPSHVHFVSEIASDSIQDFSSAFFNRWIKIGVSREIPQKQPTSNAVSELEHVLITVYDLDEPEAHYLSKIYEGLLKIENERLWVGREQYGIGPETIYTLAEAIALAKKENPQWQEIIETIAHSGYDPRLHPAQSPPSEYQKIWEAYHHLIREILTQEITNILGVRFKRHTDQTKISDLERFETILKIVMNVKELPASDRQLSFEESGVLKQIGYVPLNPGKDALPPLSVSREFRLRYTPEITKVLQTLVRASSMGRTVAIIGETGAAKTTVAGHYAKITGRKFYKYQTHAGSEYTDLTVDLNQTETGEFEKRIKELYRLLKEGNVVIDIDEANITPKILWALEPVIRGEGIVHPIFPGEEPFEIGKGVQLVLTYNPLRYSGRSEIDRRLLDRMILIWMELPTEEERVKIIEGFYGIWKDDVETQEAKRSRPLGVETSPTDDKEGVTAKTIAGEGSVDVKTRASADRRMIKGMETFDPDDMGTDQQFSSLANTPKPEAYGVFEPELYPHTRYASYGQYDERKEEWTMSGEPSISINAPSWSEAALRNLLKEKKKTHDMFTGRYRMDLSDSKWHTLPSAGAEMEFLEITAFDRDGNKLDLPLEIGKDEADNYFIRVKAKSNNVEIRYRVAVPARYYGHKVRAGITFNYPAHIPNEVREAMKLIGLSGNETDFRTVLYQMIKFFRDFTLQENGISHKHGSLYLDLVHSQCGVCRHRAFAFARTALGLGMKVRYVTTDIHAFAETLVPGTGWIRIDLGGGGDPMNMDLSPLAHERHAARQTDDFPKPETYKKTSEQFAKRMEQAMKKQGIKPQTRSRGGESGGTGGDTERTDEDDRFEQGLKDLKGELIKDVQLNDEVSAVLLKEQNDTEFIFHTMLKAIRSRTKMVKKQARAGLEIDPIAIMLKKPKPFIIRKRLPKIQTTAVSILMDFSGSMHGIKEQLGFTVGAVGRNLWRLKEEEPQHFYYDISSFTDKTNTMVGMADRRSFKENDKMLIAMKNSIGAGGTNILEAMKKKREDFLSMREAKSAKIKYMILFTDGADGNSISGEKFTTTFREEMEKYKEAGIDVIAIGIGPGAKDVVAFNEQGQHYIQIEEDRPFDIAEAIAKIAKHKLLGSGHLPQGNITEFLQIGRSKSLGSATLTPHGAILAGLVGVGLTVLPLVGLVSFWVLIPGIGALFAGLAKVVLAVMGWKKLAAETSGLRNKLKEPLATFNPETGRMTEGSLVVDTWYGRWIAGAHENGSHFIVDTLLRGVFQIRPADIALFAEHARRELSSPQQKNLSWQNKTKHLAWIGLDIITNSLLIEPLAHTLDIVTIPLSLVYSSVKYIVSTEKVHSRVIPSVSSGRRLNLFSVILNEVKNLGPYMRKRWDSSLTLRMTPASGPGLCVTGDTILPVIKKTTKFSNQSSEFRITAKREYKPIVEVTPGDYVLSLNEATGRIEPHRINGLLDMGVKPVFKLTTASGRSIKTTANHPYLVRIEDSQTLKDESPKGRERFASSASPPESIVYSLESTEDRIQTNESGKWVKVSQLKVGNEIGVPASEGLTSVGSAANFNTLDKNSVAFDVKRRAVFPNAKAMGSRRKVDQRFSANERVIQSSVVFQFFVNAFLNFFGKSFKVALAAWRKLYSIHKTDYINPSSCWIFSNGIHPFFSASAIDFFSERIKLGLRGSLDSILSISHPAGFTALLWYSSVDNLSTKASSILESISRRAKVSKINSCGTLSLSIIIAALEPRLSFNTELGTIFLIGTSLADLSFAGKSFIHSMFTTYKHNLSRSRVKPDSDILWDRIVSIEPLGFDHVYDIEVEGTHNFIGNGIFAHNTYMQLKLRHSEKLDSRSPIKPILKSIFLRIKGLFPETGSRALRGTEHGEINPRITEGMSKNERHTMLIGRNFEGDVGSLLDLETRERYLKHLNSVKADLAGSGVNLDEVKRLVILDTLSWDGHYGTGHRRESSIYLAQNIMGLIDELIQLGDVKLGHDNVRHSLAVQDILSRAPPDLLIDSQPLVSHSAAELGKTILKYVITHEYKELTAAIQGKTATEINDLHNQIAQENHGIHSLIEKLSATFPEGVALENMISFLVASTDNQRAKLVNAIHRKQTIKPILDSVPGQRTYWRQLINDFKVTQTQDKYQSLVELVANAIDAVRGNYSKEIDVQLESGQAKFIDRGKGMSLSDILTYLLIPTLTGKEGEETIGRFGMGFYSVLQLLKQPDDRVVVTTSDDREANRVVFRIVEGSIKINIESLETSSQATGTIIQISADIEQEKAYQILRERLSFESEAQINVNGQRLNDLTRFTQIQGNGVRLYVAESPPEWSEKAMTVLTINGIVIPGDTVKPEGQNVAGTLVVSLPVTSSLSVSRKNIEIDEQAIRVVKAAIDTVAQHEDRIRLLNSLSALAAHLQANNPSTDKEDDLLRYMVHQFESKAIEPGKLYLPDFADLREIITPEAVLVHPAIHSRLTEQSWPFERYLEFQPQQSDLKFYVADFHNPKRILVRYGTVVFLNKLHIPQTARAKGAFQQYLAFEGISGEFSIQEGWKGRLANMRLYLARIHWSLGPFVWHRSQQVTSSNDYMDFNVRSVNVLQHVWEWLDRTLRSISDARPRTFREVPESIIKWTTMFENFFISLPVQLFLITLIRALGKFWVLWDKARQRVRGGIPAGRHVLLLLLYTGSVVLWAAYIPLMATYKTVMALHWLNYSLMAWLLLTVTAERDALRVAESAWKNKPRPRIGTRLFLRYMAYLTGRTERGRDIIIDTDKRQKFVELLQAVSQADIFRSPIRPMQIASSFMAMDKKQLERFLDLLEHFLSTDSERFVTFLKVSAHIGKVYPSLIYVTEARDRYFEVWRGLLEQDPSHIIEVTNSFLGLPKLMAGPGNPYFEYIAAGVTKKRVRESESGLSLVPIPDDAVEFNLTTLVASYLQGKGPATETGEVTIEQLAGLGDNFSALQSKVAERLISNSANFQSTEQFVYLRELLQNAIDEMNMTGAASDDRIVRVDTASEQDRLVISFTDLMGMDLKRVVQAMLIPNVSTKRDAAGAIGRFGHGFFTVFKTADEIRFKTSRGDGTVAFIKLLPVRHGGKVIEVKVSVAVTHEYYKGTTIQVVQKNVAASELWKRIVKAKFRMYGRTVSSHTAKIYWGKDLLNEAGETLASVPVNSRVGNGNLTIYYMPKEGNVLTQSGLHIKSLEPEFMSIIPQIARDALLKAGIAIDLPRGIELLRDRSDLADSKSQLAKLAPYLFEVSLKATVRLLINGSMDIKLLPYDLYSHIRRYLSVVPSFINADIFRITNGETIDWRPYQDTNNFAMLLASVPFINVKGLKDKQSLLETALALNESSIRYWHIPRNIRHYLFPHLSDRWAVIKSSLSFLNKYTWFGFGVLVAATLFYGALVDPVARKILLFGGAGFGVVFLFFRYIVMGKSTPFAFIIDPVLDLFVKIVDGISNFGYKYFTVRWESFDDQTLPERPAVGLEALWAFIKISEDLASLSYEWIFSEPKQYGLFKPYGEHTYYSNQMNSSIAHAPQGLPGMGWHIQYIGKILVPFGYLLRGRIGERALYGWAKYFHEIHSHELTHTLEDEGAWTHGATQEEKQKNVLQSQVAQQEEIERVIEEARYIGSGIGTKWRIMRFFTSQPGFNNRLSGHQWKGFNLIANAGAIVAGLAVSLLGYGFGVEPGTLLGLITWSSTALLGLHLRVKQLKKVTIAQPVEQLKK